MSDASPLASLIALVTSPELIGVMLLAVPLGVIVGAIPGVGGKFGIAISIPFVFGMDPVAGAVFLVAMHAVVHTGGSLPGILLGIPGGGPDAAIVVDGYPMARRGEAGRAIGASLTSSAVGGVVGGLLLAALVPVVWPIVLAFGPAETFLLALLGITFVAAVSGGDLLKALVSGSVGLMLSFVGAEPLEGVSRFTFGQLFLWDGIDLMAAVPAIFAIPEMIEMGAAVTTGSAASVTAAGLAYRQMAHGFADVIRHRWLTFRASCLGALIGLVPGLGGEVASWVCYGHAAQTSRHPEEFGRGAVEGVIAPDAANNSKEGGALLPTLFFGIPGSSGMALLLAAFVALGIQPGPQLALGNMELVWTLIWALVLANLAGSVMLAACGKWLGLIAFTAGNRLVPFVLVLVIAGCLLASVHVQSLIVMVVLGALGCTMKRLGWPRPPFAIGLVLGSITEKSFHQAWSIWGGAFLLKPGAIILFLLIAASITFHVLTARRSRAIHLAPTERPSSPDHAGGSAPLGDSTGAKPHGFTGDLWLSAILCAGFLAMFATALDYPPAARAVPMLVGGFGAGLSAIQCVLTMRRRRVAGAPTSASVLSGHVTMFVWLMAAAASVSVIGILAGGAFFVAAFLRGRLRESWPAAIQAGLLLSAVLHLTLERGLGVYLFEGLIWR